MNDDLPPGLELLWGLREKAAREPKLGLSADRIVDAAIEIADADGLEAVTMSRVAKRLGFTTMSLYRHVRSKDELVALMVDTAVGPPTSLDATSSNGWRSGLGRWAWELLRVLRLHPWLARAALATLPFGPSRLAWFDRALRALADTTLTEDEKAAIVRLVNGYVFAEAWFGVDVEGGARESSPADDATTAFPDLLSALVDAKRFPALSRALDARIFDPSDSDPDAEFDFGLERVLDGIERLVLQRAGDASE